MLRRNFEPHLEAIAPGRGRRLWDVDDSFEKPVTLCLQLASGAADALSGCYLSVGDDLTRLIEHAEEITARDLYRMRVGKLDA